jgi:HEAT repeat protein
MKQFLLIWMALMLWGDKCWLTSCNAGEENVSATNSISDPQFHGQPLSYWLTHLYHYVGSAWTIDHDSEKAVLQIGSNAVPMLSSWITKPEGGGWGQPDHAVEAFQLLGPTAKAAVPDLIKAIGQNQNYPERALVYIGKDAVPLLADKLVETLSETNNPYYYTGIRMAVRTTNGFYIRDRILGVLARLGTNAEAALPALIQTVATNRHQPYYLREGNWMGGGFFQDPYNVLARVGQNQPEIVVPILLNEFSNSPWPMVETQRFAAAIETQRRNHIIQAMKVWGTNQAKAFMPVLIAALSDNRTNDWSRIQMGDTLTEIGSNQPAVLIPVFLAGLTNKANDEHIQCGLAGSLFKIARDQPDIVVPALITVYTNSGIEVRCSIAGMLATFGDKSRSMVPTLMQDSRSKELLINRPGWKIDLAVAAKKIAPENTNALSALIDDFDSCDGGTKQWRFRAFGELGTNAWEAVPTMLKFLTNDTTQIRCDAIGALDAIGVKSDEYIHILSQVVSATNVFVSQSAQSSLCSMAANSQPAFEAVLKYVISAPVDRDEVQIQAIWRLTELSRQNPKFLVNCLDSPDPAVRSGDLVVFYHLNKCVRESFGKLFMMSAKEPDAAIRTLADFVHKQQLGLQ